MPAHLSILPQPVCPSPGAIWLWLVCSKHRAKPSDKNRPDPKVDLVWRYIPAGHFRMGHRGYLSDEEPVHDVLVPGAFWMLETPVTQAQWLDVVGGKNPSYQQPEVGWQGLPVECITWHMANEWCRKLDELARETSPDCLEKWQASLPSETHWEYACRGGSTSEFFNGDGLEALSRVGWFIENSGNRTHPVGTLQVDECDRHPWGLHDMHGNVWEWCLDPGDAESYLSREEPFVADWNVSGGDTLPHVMRGGGRASPGTFCRSAYRGMWRPGLFQYGHGFRPCLRPKNP